MLGVYIGFVQSQGAKPMKVIGRKGAPKADLQSMDGMQKMANSLRQGRPFVPKGVWRFKSFEEADAWLIKMMARS